MLLIRLRGGLELTIKYEEEEIKFDIYDSNATLADLKKLLKSKKKFPSSGKFAYCGVEMKDEDKLSKLKDGDVIDVTKNALQEGEGLILSFDKCMISHDDD